MGLLERLFANIENTRGQLKRRGLLDLPNIMGEHVAQNIAGPGLLAGEHSRSVVPEVREPARQKMTDTALGLLGAIKAYHGSPHKFDKFDMSKIGTGEGAQAYGWGGYLAEAPIVAKGYADKLAKPGKAWKTAQDITDSLAKGDVDRIAFLEQKGTWSPEEFKAMREIAADPSYTKTAGKERQDKFWELWDKKARQGYLYEVSLRWPDAAREAADPLGPQHFLDWDKPLSQQPESVRKLISIEPSGKYGGYSLKINGKEVTDPLETREEAEQLVKNLGYKGEDVYRHIIRSDSSNGMRAGSDYLRSLGIPGIRYLDGGSRAAGEGTANYVTFDDALVEILKRNGVPIK